MIYESVEPCIFGHEETIWSVWKKQLGQLDFWPLQMPTKEAIRYALQVLYGEMKP